MSTETSFEKVQLKHTLSENELEKLHYTLCEHYVKRTCIADAAYFFRHSLVATLSRQDQ